MSISENILNKQFENIKSEEMEIIPCNTGVLVQLYDDNPYKTINRTESGLIFGIESNKKYKSNETGEIEENDEFVACAKVIAVGPKCENVQVGEDVYLIKHILKPIPYRKKGYWEISEQNILCRLKPINEKENER